MASFRARAITKHALRFLLAAFVVGCQGSEPVGVGGDPQQDTPVLQRAPTSLAFTAEVGGAAPASQALTVTNAGTGTLSWSVTSDQSWLGVSPASGTSTGEGDAVTVTVDIAGLSAGSYAGTLTVTGAGGSQTTAVTLTVTAAAAIPALDVSATSLSFSATEGGSSPADQTLSITNTGDGTLSWSVSDDQSWLTLSPTSGTSTGETDDVTVSVDITGLTAGTYDATITTTGDSPATGSPQTTTVTLTVDAPSAVPVLDVSSPSLSFSGVQGGASPADQTLSITNTGSGTLTWSVSGDQSWLSLSPTSGTSTGEADTVTVSVDITGLTPGTYDATITSVGDSPATGTPFETSVSLTVGAPPVLQRSPATMSFSAVEGGASPADQTLSVTNVGSSTMTWSVSDDQSWLSLSPASGTSVGETDDVTVSVDITGLSAGTYDGTITVEGDSPATGSPQTTAVTLTVEAAPALQRSPASMNFTSAQGGSNPSSQALSITNTGGSSLDWTVSDNQSWLSVSPGSGSSTGETDNVSVSVDISGLTPGSYGGTITIDGAAPATGTPATTSVSLVVLPPPAVVSTSVADGDSLVAIGSSFEVTFSTDMSSSTINTSNITLTGPSGAVSGSVGYNGTSHVATFTPSAPLTEFRSSYTLQVGTGVQDTYGAPIPSTVAVSFYTEFLSQAYYYRLWNDFLGSQLVLDTYADTYECYHIDRDSNTSGSFWYFVPLNGGLWNMRNAYGGDARELEATDGIGPCRLDGVGNFTGHEWYFTAFYGGYALHAISFGDGYALDNYNDGRNPEQAYMATAGAYSGQVWHFERSSAR